MTNLAIRVAFRTDGSETLGGGHVVRCVALARQLRSAGASVLFVCRAHRGHFGEFIRAEGFDVAMLPAPTSGERLGLGVAVTNDAQQTRRALQAWRPDWLVVDHYEIDAQWERLLLAVGTRLVVIDDLADRAHEADILIDPGFQPVPGRYAALCPSQCRMLLGPRFALLRPEFAEATASRPETEGMVRRIVASAGATDPHGMLEKVIAAWIGLGETRPTLDLLVGSTSPNLQRLQQLCSALPGATLHVQSDRLVQLMARADLMVVAGGGMNWERCCLALPAIIVCTAGNQTNNVAALTRRRTAIAAGDVAALQPERLRRLLARLIAHPASIRRMAARSRSVVDGRGALRCAATMLSDQLRLCRASPTDADLVWPWRNAASTRRYFNDPSAVPLDVHRQWWGASLEDPARWLAIARIGALPVGVVRLDSVDDEAVLSIYLDPALTGLGFGPRLLHHARLHCPAVFPRVRRIRADIHEANEASRAAFRQAGYTDTGRHWQIDL